MVEIERVATAIEETSACLPAERPRCDASARRAIYMVGTQAEIERRSRREDAIFSLVMLAFFTGFLCFGFSVSLGTGYLALLAVPIGLGMAAARQFRASGLERDRVLDRSPDAERLGYRWIIEPDEETSAYRATLGLVARTGAGRGTRYGCTEVASHLFADESALEAYVDGVTRLLPPDHPVEEQRALPSEAVAARLMRDYRPTDALPASDPVALERG